MANVLFTRTSDPNSKPVTDGQLIFDTSGNGKMYLDNGTDRLVMGGALTVDATLSKTSTNPVQNKAVAGVMLDTLSDIGNVTSKGFLTDALAVKELNTNVNELNNSLGGMKFGVDSDGNYGYIKAGADSVTPFRSDYFFLNSMETSVYNAPMDMGYITVTIPTDDCYILYGTTFSVDNGVAMRTNSQTSFSISSGVTPLFEATTGNNNLIGLVHCRGLKGKSLTINTNLSVYRMSARIYYQNQ